MTKREKKPLTLEYLNSLKQELEQRAIAHGSPSPIFGDKAGQTSVRFSNKHYKGKTDTSKQECINDKDDKISK